MAKQSEKPEQHKRKASAAGKIKPPPTISASPGGLEALTEAEKLRITLDYTYNWEYWMTPDGRILYMSPSCKCITGYKREEFIKNPALLTEIVHPDDKEKSARHNEAIDQDPLFTARFRIITKKGETRWIEHACQAVFDDDGKWLGRRASNRDITEQKKAEEQLVSINRELRAISDCNQAMVRAKSEHDLCTEVCTIMCEQAGYRMAWVGVAEHDKAKLVRPCGWGGVEDGYLSEIQVTWADNELGRGPTGLAIRSGKTQFMQDFDRVPAGAPWREAAMARGYRSSIALPLKNSTGEVIGAFMLYADRPNAFFPEEVKLLEELAADLGFGIMALRNRDERRKAEQALKESEHDLNRAQAVGRIGSWRLDLQHNELIWSDETYRLFGIPPATPMTYETFIAAVHPDDRAYVDEKWSAALAGAPYDCEHRIVVGDEISWVRELAELDVDENGQLTAGFGTTQDITERRQVQMALADSEERFRVIAENTQGLIGVSSLENGTVLYLNPAFENAFGFDRNEFIGRKAPDYWVDPSQRPALIDLLNKQGYIRDYEIHVKKKDGTTFWVSSSLAIVNYDGVPALLNTALDITERKEQEEKLRKSEERFRRLFASMSEGVCEHEIVYNKKGKPIDYRILECNPTYELITQIPRDDAVGKTASELYGAGEPPYFEIYAQVAESGEPAFFETYFPPMQKHFAISVFSPGKGKFVTVFQDVTERKR